MSAAQPNGQPRLGVAATVEAPPQDVGAEVEHRDSPAPAVDVVKDSKSETVAVLTPSKSRNTTQGLGKVGEEELGHLTAKPVVLGGAEGVVGEARGAQPEWIAKVRKVRTAAEEAQMSEAAKRREEDTIRGPNGERGVPAITFATDSAASSAASSMVTKTTSSSVAGSSDAASTSTVVAADGDDAASDDKQGPKWLRKVKHKPRAASRDSMTLNGTPPSESDGGVPTGLVRSRSRSIGTTPSAASVSFAPGERTSADRVITDRDGKPVPLVPGKSTTPDAASNELGGGGTAASTSTSVKDKVLETHDVEVSRLSSGLDWRFGLRGRY